jgi:hypothetical protein
MRGFAKRAGLGVAAAICLTAVIGTASASAGGLVSAEITAQVSKRNIFFDRSTKVSGELTTSATIGFPPTPAGRTVTLYEKRYPYASETTLGTTTTAADGSYEFTGLEPGFNAYYRVAVTQPASATSEDVPVWVYPRAHFPKVRFIGPRRVATHFTVDFSPEFPVDLGGRKITWYFLKGGHHRYNRIEHSTTHQPRPGLATGKTRFHIPDGRYRRFYVYWCFEVTDVGEDTGMGKPPTNEPCPKHFRVRGHTRSKAAADPRTAGAVVARRPTPANL